MKSSDMGPSTVVITLWRVGCNMGGCSHVGLNRIALDSPLNLALEKKSHRQLRRNLPSAPGTLIEGYGWAHHPGPAIMF